MADLTIYQKVQVQMKAYGLSCPAAILAVLIEEGFLTGDVIEIKPGQEDPEIKIHQAYPELADEDFCDKVTG